MKPRELVAWKTYVGKGGKRRWLVYCNTAWARYWSVRGVRFGAGRCVKIATFANWAEREATADEAAP